MSRRRSREGYFLVKLSSTFGKSWKRRWAVIHRNNTISQIGELQAPSALVELYMEKGAYGKTVTSILIEDAVEIKRVISKSQSYAFEVNGKDKVLFTAAGECEVEAQEWITTLKQQLLPPIKKKELTRLPGADEDSFRACIVPNNYSETHQLSGDYLVHVTNMTLGLFHLYEGSLIKEWDLRHLKKFMLQSKAPTKDVDRVAVIKVSNRSPLGEGELYLFTFSAKSLVEKIYEKLSSAMNVKSKRTRTSSMLFEIAPKELEALGKEIKSVQTGTFENGNAEETSVKSSGSTDGDTVKERADVSTQLSINEENEDLLEEDSASASVSKTSDGTNEDKAKAVTSSKDVPAGKVKTVVVKEENIVEAVEGESGLNDKQEKQTLLEVVSDVKNENVEESSATVVKDADEVEKSQTQAENWEVSEESRDKTETVEEKEKSEEDAVEDDRQKDKDVNESQDKQSNSNSSENKVEAEIKEDVKSKDASTSNTENTPPGGTVSQNLQNSEVSQTENISEKVKDEIVSTDDNDEPRPKEVEESAASNGIGEAQDSSSGSPVQSNNLAGDEETKENGDTSENASQEKNDEGTAIN